MMARADRGARRGGRRGGARRSAAIARLAHPTPEHFLPVLFPLGVADEKDELSFFNASFDMALDLDALVPAFVTDARRPALVVGAGPAGLMAAEMLARARPSRRSSPTPRRRPARKFLLAGRGGLNLTHSEPLEMFLDPLRCRARAAGAGDRKPSRPTRCAHWSAALGEATFVGVERAGVSRKASRRRRCCAPGCGALDELGVELRPRRTVDRASRRRRGAVRDARGRDAIERRARSCSRSAARSWPRLGGDGGWVEALRAAGVAVAPLEPANCGLSGRLVGAFSRALRGRADEGGALVAWREPRRAARRWSRRDGLEGGAIYALSAPLRDAIERAGAATLELDFKPDVSAEELAQRLARARGVAFDLPAQGGGPLAGRDRSDARGRPDPGRPAGARGAAESVPAAGRSASRRSRARSRARAASNGRGSTSASCCARCPACSSPAR